MQTTVENVTRLQQNRVYHHIRIFIQDKESTSKNTATEYARDIRQFFMYMRNKSIEQLEPEDLKVMNAEVLDYRTYLKKKRDYRNTSINRKINSLRSLYKFLSTNDYDVNPDVFAISNLPDDSRRIGNLAPDEVFLLAKLALETESYNKHMKYALILTAFATSMRENALQRLTLSDIRPSEDPDTYIIEPDFLDKGKQVYKEIHKIVYDAIVESVEKDARERKDDRIFTIDAKGIGKMMKRLCERAGIDPKRNVTFHSIRKAGADFAHEYTGGDMAAVTAQGNWSSPATPYKYYLTKQTNITGTAAFETIDDHIFEQLTHEELLSLVKGIGNGLGAKLRKEANRMVKERVVP